MVATLLCVVFLTHASLAFGASDPLDALAPQSLVSTGNLARLDRVFERAEAGRHITVGVIGGSITEGAAATEPKYRYANLVARWFAKTFPKAKVSLVNAGVGATGTHYGCLRAHRDLLSHHPNFVIVEFAVNDGPGKSYSETYEGVIRQILSDPNHPAVMELFLIFNHNGASEEIPEEKIGYHYGLPMISYYNVVWPLLRAKKLAWSAVQSLAFPGDFHPNNRGHALIAYFVTHFLHQCLNKLTKNTRGELGSHNRLLPPIPPLPKPLYTNIFAHTRLWEAGKLRPTSNRGWKLHKLATIPSVKHPGYWSSDKPGSVITFSVRGRAVLLSYYRHDGGYGKVSVQIDHNPPRILDAWFAATWGGYRKTSLVANHLPPGTHTVRVTLLKAQGSGSTGHRFLLMALGAAGVGNRSQ